MTAAPEPPFAAPNRIDPRLVALAVTALGGVFVPLLALDPAPLWWAAVWAAAAGLHAAAMLHFRRRWAPALGMALLLGVVLSRELELVAVRWTAWVLGLALGGLLALFFAAPAAAARRAHGTPAGDSLDRALVRVSLWLGVLALAAMALSETSLWIEKLTGAHDVGGLMVEEYLSPRLVGDGRLPWIAALSALSLGALLAGATLFRDARRIRFLAAIDENRSFELIPWSEGAAGVPAIPYLSGSAIGWGVAPRIREGASVFRERGSGAVVAWLPCDLPGSERLLRRRAALALALLVAETAGFVAIAAAFLYHVGPLTGIAAVAPRRDYTCALHRSGDVTCWGSNELGKLGDGTRRHSYAPIAVHGVKEAVSLQPPCAMLRSGEVRCWGSLFEGPSEARPIEGLSPARLLATHDFRACVVTREDDVLCWAEPGPPLWITKAPGAVSLSLDLEGGCAELPDRIQCWHEHWLTAPRRGRRDLLSPCFRPPDSEAPLPDRLARDYRSIYELTRGGRVYSWRVPEKEGELCTGPVVLGGMKGVVRIDGALALRADGSVQTWSADEKAGSCTLGKTWIEGGAVDIRSYLDTSCAVRADGTAWCWGRDNDWGQLGNGTRRPVELPSLVLR